MDLVNEIKEKIKILDYIEATSGTYAVIQNYNNYYLNKCPICNGYDKVRKCFVNIKSKKYYCPTCKNGGDIINYHMKRYNKNFKESIGYLKMYL